VQRLVRSVALLGALLFCGHAAAADPLVSLPGHVLPAIAHATREAPSSRVVPAAAPPMTLTVVLRRSLPAAFDSYLRDVYDPASVAFHKFLTPQEVSDRFGPSESDYTAVRSWFEGQGFAVTEGSTNRMTLTLAGTRSIAAQALQVEFANYSVGATSFYANTGAPSLPASIAARVEAIVGLNGLAVAQPRTNAILSVFCGWYADTQAQILSTDASGNATYSTDPTKRATYFNKCMYEKHATGYSKQADYPDPPPPAWQGVDGTGQKVGLVAFDTYLTSDVADYIAALGLPTGKLSDVTAVHVNGGASPGANQDEVLLDIDTILMIAPGAKITIFDAPFAAGSSFQAIFNAMIGAGVDVISNSWAYCEDQTTLADVQSIDTILQTAAASGISAFSGTGDHGSTCLDGSANTAHVPATSPHITAVGGTTMTLGPGATYGTEKFARPSYQNGSSSAAQRSIPDLSANADPAQGALICQASKGGCPSGLLYGGTSRSTPMWAAFAALLNQAQGTNLGFLNPQLYPLAATDAFHNAASMGTDFAHVGLGSPNLARMHQALTAQSTGAVDAAVSGVVAFSQDSFQWVPNGAGLPLLIPADGSSHTFVVVRLADGNGNILQGRTVTLSANPPGNVTISPASAVSSIDNGAVVFKVTDLAYESVTFTATVTPGNIVLQQQPTVMFIPPSAASASIVASPSPVASDGVSTTTITVTLQDGLGRPSPGKRIAISQGAAHSVIAAPVPPVTNASGQIQFTASDSVPETVTYTAVDVSDGELAVPGSATVVFTGGSTSCVGAAPVAGAGFSIAPWATGFLAKNLFFGNVNWGCPGASDPAFTGAGSSMVADFPSGDVFKLPPAGGASAGNKLSNLNPTLGQPAFGRDGRLYATHGATTGNFFTGDIVEIDPATGAQLRVVAANVTCPNGLSVDPLSGDLFFDDKCFGAGSDNPSLWRIHDPGGAATLSVYATLPSTPNGQLAFAPDGTLFVVTGYTSVKQIVRIGGTNTLFPPAMTTLSGISSFVCLTMGEAQPSGAAKSLIVCDAGGIRLIDITTNPFTATTLIASGNTGSGVIGPDGCLYAAGQDTIYKLTRSDGTCGFVPTNPGPALALNPTLVAPNPAQGGTQTFTATFKNISVPTGTTVLFTVAGANTQFKLATTDASGAASFTYVGAQAGTDTVTASGNAQAQDLTSNSVTLTWAAGKHLSFLDLSGSPSSSTAGASVVLRAALTDMSQNPAAVIAGATIQFSLGGQTCNGQTNANGVATCSLTPPPGQFTLFATYAGSAQYVAASTAQQFNVLASPPAPAPGIVFVPLEPCRIMDTRFATLASGVQGPITGNVLYNVPGFINVGQSWAQYGGTGAADCGLTNPPGGSIHAVGLVASILNPNFDAFLGISDSNVLSTVLSNVALNYTHGQGLSTMYIVPQVATNNIFFAMPAGLSAQLIFDVVGYYVVADATALQCTTQASAPTSIGVGAAGSATSPACATGYTLSSGSCDATSVSLNLSKHEASGGNTAWLCTARNNGGTSANLTATAICCRVPGK